MASTGKVAITQAMTASAETPATKSQRAAKSASAGNGGTPASSSIAVPRARIAKSRIGARSIPKTRALCIAWRGRDRAWRPRCRSAGNVESAETARRIG
jgi:hypothetical protein